MAFSTLSNPSDLYKYHVANLRELQFALDQTARLARGEIGSGDPRGGLRSLLRLYAFLLGAWAECRLQKLLHEANGFTESERNVVTSSKTQLEQWQGAVDLAFRKHHGLPNAPLNAKNIGVAHAARRDALHEVLSDELRIIIEIRNRLAHGQWHYPLNSEGSAVESEKYLLINQENLLTLQLKYSLVRHLADVVHDLVISPTAFARDFESHFGKLLQAKTNLQTRSYERWKRNIVLRSKHARAT